MAALLCGVLALPAPTAARSENVSTAYAANASTQDKQPVKVTGEIKRVHTHALSHVPTSAHLAKYATGTTRARYRYVCKTCGKELKKTYAWGKTLTWSLAELKSRNANKPTGGIAFTGSSLFARWSSLAADINNATGYPINKIYNMAIGGSNASRWAKDDYVDAVADLKPSVVVISGVNGVRYGGAVDMRTDEQAAAEGAEAVATYIDKLKAKLPGAQILVVGGIKTPSDYLREYGECDRIVSWDRIDLYNDKLQEVLKQRSGVSYIDIQNFFMMSATGSMTPQSNGSTGGDVDSATNANASNLAFYCDKKRLMKASSLKLTQEIVWARQEYGDLLDPYFRRDLLHPTALSYEKVWTPYVGDVAVQMARGAVEYSLGK